MHTPPFEKFPRFVRQAAVSAIGWRNRKRRYSDEFELWQGILSSTADWSRKETEGWQHKQLVELAKSATKGTRYYSKSLPAIDAIETAATLRQALDLIPVLEKNSLRESPFDFRNASVVEIDESSTSGSTGSPMKVGHDAASIQRRFAFLTDHLRMAGIEKNDPSVRLSGRIICAVEKKHKKPWLYNAAENQIFLSTYHLNDSHGPAITKMFSEFKPVLLDGYPSGILETLRLLDRHSHNPDSLKAIITTAETLDPDMRAELSDLSGGVPVMDYYAASEGVPLVQQCPQGTYHVRWQSGIFEVDGGATIGFEGDGELICTSFVQDRTPLIRYRTGDVVRGMRSQKIERCGCGLSTPTVESVVGRLEDLVYTPDGRSLGMFTYRTLKLIDGLGETQVIQHGYSDFEVNTVTKCDDYDLDSLAGEVKDSFERALGYPISLRFNSVSTIPKGANGKLRLVISKVGK